MTKPSSRYAWLVALSLCVACGSDGGSGGGSSGNESGGVVGAQLDDYAAEINRSINVRCGQCWKELGHMSEQACRDEAKTDVLGDTQRACFSGLAKAHASEVKVYLTCRTAAASFYNDCFSKSCDLRACAVAYASFTPSEQCMTGDDAGDDTTKSAVQCDPIKSDL
jgi:hypothetical protein